MAETVVVPPLVHKLSAAETDILLHSCRGFCGVTGEDPELKITLIITFFGRRSP
jgi:hypothetical protein